MLKETLVLVAALVVSACSGGRGASQLYDVKLAAPDPFAVSSMGHQEYLIGPLDKVNVRVFGQEKLSVEKVQVDAGGTLVLPLVGAIVAAGKTPQQLSSEIGARLGEKYLQDPHVSVLIDESVSQRITVTGAVNESGVYPLKGPTTLLQAVALAKGPDQKLANLKQVAVFRIIEGRRAAALFDLGSIRDGRAEDPQVYGGDTVVVAGSQSKAMWRELVSALPGIGAFAYF